MDVLLVEDNPGDVHLITQALANRTPQHVLHVAMDGEEALLFLRKQGKYAGVPTPRIVILDINLPKKSGLEVLEEMKADQVLGAIPVVMLSSSQAQQDVAKSYLLHANCYVVKPTDFDSFEKAIDEIETFWLSTARLPEDSDG